VLGEYLAKTFGPKIDWYKKVCESGTFTPEHQARLDESCILLREQLPKRNLIIHGQTYEIGRGDEPPEMCRIEIKKDDSKFRNKFVADFNADHGFSTAKIEATTAFTKSIRKKVAEVSVELVNEAVARSSPP